MERALETRPILELCLVKIFSPVESFTHPYKPVPINLPETLHLIIFPISLDSSTCLIKNSIHSLSLMGKDHIAAAHEE
nr:hypothetical protein Q903MT_gene5968 [Picea sitchensis]